jgi:hypothetical protein
MGRSRKPAPPPPPKAPPPPAEDVTAEVIAPTMRQEAARRARMGAYVTRGQKIGAGGQLLGAAPIQLANVRAAAQAGKGEKIVAPSVKGYSDILRQRGVSGFGSKIFARATYDQFKKDFIKKEKERRKKPINPEGGMTI